TLPGAISSAFSCSWGIAMMGAGTARGFAGRDATVPASRRPVSGSSLRWRLSALMFLVYAPAGAILPQLAVYLREAGFSDSQIGAACATQALGSLLAPLLAGQVADRWARADRWLAI